MTITKEQIEKEYTYDADKGQLIKIGGRARKDPADRTAPYCNVLVGDITLKEHRAIWILHNGPIPDGMQLDHRDGNSKNNRIENLRLCTVTQNNQNKALYSNGKSGFKGVHAYSQSGQERFFAQIQAYGERKYLGSFDTAKEAAIAYDTAARMLFGEFARTNKDMGLL